MGTVGVLSVREYTLIYAEMVLDVDDATLAVVLERAARRGKPVYLTQKPYTGKGGLLLLLDGISDWEDAARQVRAGVYTYPIPTHGLHLPSTPPS